MISRISSTERPAGLDERPSDVAVLDQALAEWNPAGSREADRGGRARIRDGEDEVRLDGSLLGEAFPHPDPRAVQLDAAELRVGPREVDELEDAHFPAVVRGDRLARADTVLVDDDELAGADLALEVGSEEVERRGL